MFAERGHDAATVDAIAARAGISPTSELNVPFPFLEHTARDWQHAGTTSDGVRSAAFSRA